MSHLYFQAFTNLHKMFMLMKSIMYMFNAFKVSTRVMYDHIKYHFEK